MKSNIYNNSNIILCGTLKEIEDIKLRGLTGRKRAVIQVDKGVVRKKDGNNNLEIPMIIQDIVVIKPAEALTSSTPTEYEPVGLMEELEVGKRYLFLAEMTKVILILKDGSEKKVSHIDVKEIYESDDKYENRNYSKGKFQILSEPKINSTDRGVFGTLRLMRADGVGPRITGYTRGKNANFCTILREKDIIDIGGSLYSNQYSVVDSNEEVNYIDYFSIYINRISKSDK